MWIRVTAETWRATAEKLKALGYTYFGYVSAIDWLPSPFGKSEDDASGPSGERDSTIKQGYTGGDTRFQVMLVWYSHSPQSESTSRLMLLMK
jgi:NADH-quinone oxidoreductase subunit C